MKYRRDRIAHTIMEALRTGHQHLRVELFHRPGDTRAQRVLTGKVFASCMVNCWMRYDRYRHLWTPGPGTYLTLERYIGAAIEARKNTNKEAA